MHPITNQPSELDLAEASVSAGGAKLFHFHIPEQDRVEAERLEAHRQAYQAHEDNRQHQEQIQSRVREIVASPPEGAGTALMRHLQWMQSAERKAVAAAARASEAKAAADRYAAAALAYSARSQQSCHQPPFEARDHV